jgi:ligand-binding sensor domain-containing protein
MDEELAIFEYSKGRWHVEEKLQGTEPNVVALDPSRPNKVYCGTFGKGLWVTDDAGNTWRKKINESSIASEAITSLALNSKKSIYIGTEPSKIYRSDDGGETWIHLSGLENLPSSRSCGAFLRDRTQITYARLCAIL